MENPAGFAPDLPSFADWCVTTPPKVRLVAPEGVEPSTLASSGRRSTVELQSRNLVRIPRIGLGIDAPKAPVLPLHYILIWLASWDSNPEHPR